MKMRLQQAFFNSSQGPQHREIGFPISTDNASWGVGPNTENFEKKFYRQCELGCGPQHREIGFPISRYNASWGGAPQENLKKITGTGSWGVGPNTEAYDKSAYDNVQVGVVQR